MARPAEVRFVGNRATTISCNDDERVNLGVIMHGRPAGWLAVIPSHRMEDYYALPFNSFLCRHYITHLRLECF